MSRAMVPTIRACRSSVAANVWGRGFDIDDLDIYYRDCVIGGEGAFMIPVRDLKAFGDAVRTKLLLEIAGLMPAADPALRALPAAAGPTVSCMIGERQWRERWGN